MTKYYANIQILGGKPVFDGSFCIVIEFPRPTVPWPMKQLFKVINIYYHDPLTEEKAV